jgi:mitochondrial Rho GTPase 1
MNQIPVIVAENKEDLFRPSTSAGITVEQALARKRQQIVSLMQQFPFVRQCIKCSAKNLLRVDDVFLKAQQAVLYPFTPLYDLETAHLSVECKRACNRIFRMFDRDHDGLLSDAELDRFQRETYHVDVFDRDFAAWKKVVTRNNLSDEIVIQDGKFTISGFLAIFDVFICQNRLDVVWQALRKFQYDDNLNLHVPDSVTAPLGDYVLSDNWRLSSSAKEFLAALFHQFDTNKDGTLSPDDIVSIFSILAPPALPPWHPLRTTELFEGCFSLPKAWPSSKTSSPESSIASSQTTPPIQVPAALSQSLSNSGFSILSANESLPSIDVGGMHHAQAQSLTFLEWMGHWHVIAAISPTVARAELFRLGHIEEGSDLRKSRKKRLGLPIASSMENFRLPEPALHSREARILVLGSQASGKTALLNALRGTFDGASAKAFDMTPTTRPETSTTFIKLKRTMATTASTTMPSSIGKQLDEDGGEEILMHFVFTDVPETAAASQEEHYRELTELFGATISATDRVCDLALLVFDSTKLSSWMYAKELESTLLTKETPRVFVATKADLLRAVGSEGGDDLGASVLDAAELHCRDLDLESPLLTSANVLVLRGSDNDERNKILNHLARCALNEPGIDRLRSRPHEEQKRREAARRRYMIWLGGIVSVGVVVVVGMGLLWSGSAKKDQKSSSGSFSWLRSWFSASTVEEAAPRKE